MRFPHIYDFILNKLGYPTVKVELTCHQVELCVEEAMKKWVQYQGYTYNLVQFDVEPDSNGYDVPEDVPVPYDEFLIDVYYEPHDVQYDDDTLYLLINQYFYYFRSSTKQLMTDYTMFKGYIEDLKRTLGAYGTWQLMGGDKIYLYPKPSRALKALVLYKAYPGDSIVDENQWVMRYSLALAKGVLAQIRGKFANGILGPGGAITLNASDLQGQSDKETEALLNELRQRAKPVGIVTG